VSVRAALPLGAVPHPPARQHIRQVVLGMLGLAQGRAGSRPACRRPAAAGACRPGSSRRPHVVEPHVVGAAGVGLGEEQDGGGHARIGLEHARGQRHHGVELVVLHDQAAQFLVRLAAAEQHAVGHDDRGPAAGLQQAQEQRQEQQLGLLGLDDGQQVLGGVLVVQAARQTAGWPGSAVGLFVARVVLRQRILVADVGVVHPVQRQVHAADAQHGVVEVVAVEHAVVEVLARVASRKISGACRAGIRPQPPGSRRCRWPGRTSRLWAWARSSPPSAG
jgi:hypothetical protein